MSKEQFLQRFFSKANLVSGISQERLTWEQALWLFETSPGNRNMLKTNLGRIVMDMRNDNFGRGTVVIFDKQKRLRDGHHRLWGQVLTNTTQEYIIRYEVPEWELANIDRGAPRNPSAAVGFVDGFEARYGSRLQGKEATIANIAIQQGYRLNNVCLSANGQAQTVLLFKEGIKFYLETVGGRVAKKITTNAIIAAVFVRALVSGADREKLKYAIDYLIDGGSRIEKQEVSRLDGTESLSRLRDALLLRQKTAAGGVAGKEIYCKTERMLSAFLSGKDLYKVTEANEEMFPVDASSILLPPSKMEIQQSILGHELDLALRKWSESSSLKNNSVMKPTEIASQLICGNLINKSSGYIVQKMVKAMKECGEIDIWGKVKLTPYNCDASRITECLVSLS